MFEMRSEKLLHPNQFQSRQNTEFPWNASNRTLIHASDTVGSKSDKLCIEGVDFITSSDVILICHALSSFPKACYFINCFTSVWGLESLASGYWCFDSGRNRTETFHPLRGGVVPMMSVSLMLQPFSSVCRPSGCLQFVPCEYLKRCWELTWVTKGLWASAVCSDQQPTQLLGRLQASTLGCSQKPSSNPGLIVSTVLGFLCGHLWAAAASNSTMTQNLICVSKASFCSEMLLISC